MVTQFKVTVTAIFIAGLSCLLWPSSAAAVIPNSDNPDAYTEKQFRQDLLEYNKRTMSGAYLKVGNRDPRWDDLVVELLDAQAVLFVNYKAYRSDKVPVVTSKDRRYDIAKQLKELECSDPMAGYVILLHSKSKEEGYLDYARWVYRSLLDSEYPANRKTAIAWRLARLLNQSDQKEEAARVVASWVDLICQAVAEPDMSLEDQYFMFRVVKDQIDEDWLPRWESVCQRIDTEGPANPWLVGAICGFYHVEEGWEVRGGGYANTVTDDGWVGFKEHMSSARRNLVDAWGIAPQFPDVSAKMITVSMGQSTGEERLWFDRAVQAQFDYYRAYSSYIWSLRPRWGGSLNEMYAFGLECLETDRFDTRVPSLFYRSLKDIADDQEHYGFWKRPGVYEQCMVYFESRKSEPNPSDEPPWWDSMKAATAWRMGRYDDSVYWMKRLGDDLSTKAFTYVDGDPLLAPSECYARMATLEPDLRLARRSWLDKKYRNTSETINTIIERMEPGDPARPYLRHLSIWARRLHQDAKGTWIDLLGQPDLLGWKVHYGEWSVDDQGRLTGMSEKTGLELECRYNLGHRVEITGTLSLLESPKPDWHNGGILLSYRKEKDGSDRMHRDVLLYDEWDKAVTSQNYKYDRAGHPVAIGKTNTFQIEMWDEHLRLTVNDQVVCEHHKMKYDLPDKQHPFAIGGRYNYPGASVRFDELKGRRLDQRPAWVADPDQHDKTDPATP